MKIKIFVILNDYKNYLFSKAKLINSTFYQSFNTQETTYFQKLIYKFKLILFTLICRKADTNNHKFQSKFNDSGKNLNESDEQ